MGGQVLNSESKFEFYETYREEKMDLLNKIRRSNVPGIVFLSGDVHHSEVSKYSKDGYPLHEITISPLTAGVYKVKKSENEYLVDGTLTNVRNFGFIEISGPRHDRKLHLKTCDSDGKELWDYVISQKELQ